MQVGTSRSHAQPAYRFTTYKRIHWGGLPADRHVRRRRHDPGRRAMAHGDPGGAHSPRNLW